jgi:hypothetical protein
MEETSSNSSTLQPKKKEKFFTHAILLQTEDANRIPIGTPFIVKLKIQVQGILVFIHLPALNFELPVPGYVFTAGQNLPRRIWPTDSVYQSNTLEADQTNLAQGGYDLYIGNDGSLRIRGKGNVPIAAGPQVTHAKTITYMLLKFDKKIIKEWIHDIKLFDGFSNVIRIEQEQTSGSGNDFLEYYKPDIINDTIAFTWADNSASPFPYNLNTMTRVGRLIRNSKGTIKQVKLEDPVMAITTPQMPKVIRTYEQTIAINPVVPGNLVAVTSYQDNNQTGSGLSQMWRAVSFDNGKNWISGRVDVVTGLPQFRSDPYGIFDKFGNYWLIYMNSTPTLGLPIGITLLISTDQGLTFREVTTLLSPAPTAFFDFPKLYMGGDGQGGIVIWTSWVQNFFITHEHVAWVGYARVRGFNNFDGLITQPIPVTDGRTFTTPDIAASLDGKVFLGEEPYIPPPGTDNNKDGKFFLFTDLLGVPGLPNFDGPKLVFMDNLGQNGTSGNGAPPVPFQQKRGVPGRGIPAFAYDNKRQRLWILVIDKQPETTFNMVIYLQYSDNNGASWSPTIEISDVVVGPRAIASLVIDRDTGDLIAFWYDSRNSTDQGQSVQPFGVIIPANIVNKLKNIQTAGDEEDIPENITPIRILQNGQNNRDGQERLCQ